MGLSATIILLMLLLATQTMVVLQRRSIVDSIAHDFASRLATGSTATATALTKEVIALTGDRGASVEIPVSADPDLVVVIVHATSPSLLKGPFHALVGVDRTATRRKEIFR